MPCAYSAPRRSASTWVSCVSCGAVSSTFKLASLTVIPPSRPWFSARRRREMSLAAASAAMGMIAFRRADSVSEGVCVYVIGFVFGKFRRDFRRESLRDHGV